MKLQLMLTIILMITSSPALAQQSSRSQNDLPEGNWILSCGPSRTRGSVVDLYMVGSDASNGIKVTDVWLENRSSQDVAAVKIGWKLYERSNPSRILMSGETPQFLGVILAAGEKRVATFPVVSFAKIYGPLLRNGRIEGNYKIELWVTEVLFDGSNAGLAQSTSFPVHKTSWKDAKTDKVTKVASRPAPETDDDFGCPNQECGWSNPQSCYTCFNNQGSSCSWSNCSYCRSGRCSALIE